MQRHGAGRRIDLYVVVGVERAHTNERGALRQADLQMIVIEIEDLEGGLRREANRVRADVQLGARVGVGPEMVAGGERIVECRARPVVDISRTEGDFALEVARARDARRGILLLVLGVNGSESAEEERSRSDEYTSPAHTSISE